MKLYLIRHGKTRGNLEGRYIGCRTDEALCPEGIEELRALTYPPARRLLVSPLKRCLQSAAIIYPGLTPEIIPEFRECDFGAFEGKNYRELNGDPAYQAWIDSNGTLPFPDGESQAQMSARVNAAFAALDLFSTQTDTAIIAHGGTLMAIMSLNARPPQDYFFYQPKNRRGYWLKQNGEWGTI